MINFVLVSVVYALLGYLVVELLDKYFDIPDSKDVVTYAICIASWPIVLLIVAALIIFNNGGEEY